MAAPPREHPFIRLAAPLHTRASTLHATLLLHPLLETNQSQGRPTNSVKMGIVGLPNVGKSTFFNILCKMNVAAENYPFCTVGTSSLRAAAAPRVSASQRAPLLLPLRPTCPSPATPPSQIDPNLSRVEVPDERFDHLCASFKTKSAIPAVLTVTDIAGLVKGAAEGAGLGNAFLSHIGAVDAIYHVCRAFESDDIVHVEGSVEPTRDLDIIHAELRKKDMAGLATRIEPLKKAAERGGAANKEAKELYTMFVKFLAWLEEGKDIRTGDWSPAEVEELNSLALLTAKPVVYLVNMSEKAFIAKKSKFLPLLADWLKARGTDDKMIPFSCEFEGKLVNMSAEDAAKYCETVGAKSVLPRIIRTGYTALGLVHYFTASANEVRAWSVKKDTPAPKAAAVIHGDFEKHFISSEIYSYADYKEHGADVAAVRAAGKIRMEGRKYEVQDGDICFCESLAGRGGGGGVFCLLKQPAHRRSLRISAGKVAC